MSRWHFDLCFTPEPGVAKVALTEQADVLEMLVEGLGSNMSFAGWRIYGTDLGHRVEVRLWGNASWR